MRSISIGIISALFSIRFPDLVIPGTHQELDKNQQEGWMDGGMDGCIEREKERRREGGREGGWEEGREQAGAGWEVVPQLSAGESCEAPMLQGGPWSGTGLDKATCGPRGSSGPG